MSGLLPYKTLFREPWKSQNNISNCTKVDCPLELDGKALLPKIPHALKTWKNQARTGMALFSLLASPHSARRMGQDCHQQSYQAANLHAACKLTDRAGCAHWYNSGKPVTVFFFSFSLFHNRFDWLRSRGYTHSNSYHRYPKRAIYCVHIPKL